MMMTNMVSFRYLLAYYCSVIL